MKTSHNLSAIIGCTALLCACQTKAPAPEASRYPVIEPGEQAPLADPGQNNFGGKLMYVVHHSEGKGPRKPEFWDVDLSGDKLVLKDRIYVDENFDIK